MPIQFKAKLWSAMEGKGWTFVTMPKAASEKLPKRGRIAIQVNGFAFKTSAFPDGEGSHQFVPLQNNDYFTAAASPYAARTAPFLRSSRISAPRCAESVNLRCAPLMASWISTGWSLNDSFEKL